MIQLNANQTDNQSFKVFISSTTKDLAVHRDAIKQAIWRCDMNPVAMERDTAVDSSAVDYSLDLVDEARIYVGIFAHRYGYIPNGYDISITEMEYRRALQRNIPILIFIMAENHQITVNRTTAADFFEFDDLRRLKLENLKRELIDRHVVGFFSSVDDLSGQVYQALEKLKTKKFLATLEKGAIHSPSVSLIPSPPQPYIAHKYVQTRDFFGRSSELRAINEWARDDSAMMILEAIGGIGKSALKWYWVNNYANQVIENLDGVIWWSFYETDATVTNFVSHCLAYITGKPLEHYTNISRLEKENLLLDQLQKKRYLLILDGLERILVAYHRMDAPRLNEEEMFSYDTAEKDSNGVKDQNQKVYGELERQIVRTRMEEEKSKILRMATDPLDGLFLRKLVECKPSKILVSTRLTPYDLQDSSNQLPPSITHLPIDGLDAGDALDMMLNFGIVGHWGAIRRFMEEFGYHPLVLGVIAGHINNYPPAPRNFNIWFENEGRRLHLTDIDLATRRAHILQYALHGLPDTLGEFLGRIAAFRYPVDYSAIKVLNPYSTSDALHNGLLELEDRGVLNWDRTVNRYDLHPIVRAIAFGLLTQDSRRDTYVQIADHFQGLPPENLEDIQDVSQLRRTLEIYHALVGSGREDDAARLFGERLNKVLQYKIAAYHQIIELLEPLFPSGVEQSRIQVPEQSSDRFRDLINAYSYLDEDDTALEYETQQIRLQLSRGDAHRLGVSLRNYANLLYSNNQLAKSVYILTKSRELAKAAHDHDGIAMSYFCLMEVYNDMGLWDKAEESYLRFSENPPKTKTSFWRTNPERHRAEIALTRGEDPMVILQRSWRSALQSWQALGQRHILLYRGELALKRNDYETASSLFEQAILMARKSGSATEAKIALGGLARTRLLEGRFHEAEELVEQGVSEIDAAEVYSRLEQTAINLRKATQYANLAYKKAWADGPPFIWWWQLQRAKNVLKGLNLKEPALPGFVQVHFPVFPFEAEVLEFIENSKLK